MYILVHSSIQITDVVLKKKNEKIKNKDAVIRVSGMNMEELSFDAFMLFQ